MDMARDDVLRPVTKAVTTHLTLATAAARHMIPRRTGVILAMGGGREAIPNLGGSHAAAFLASDRAPTMTATEVNITGGAVID